RSHLARRALWASAALVLVLVAGSLAALLGPTPPGLRVRALDVGQGDAFLIELDGRTLLVDGGPDPARLLAELGASLPPWNRRIDVIALTHAHADHAAGLIGVLERYDVGLALEPVGLSPGAVATAWGDRIARAHVPRRAVAAGARMRVGDATLAALGRVPTYRTDRDGTVELDQGGNAQLIVRTHANGLPPPRGGSLPHAPPAR